MSIPPDVIDVDLYMSIKNKMKKRYKAQDKPWSAYASGQLVREYKRQGGRYRTNSNKNKNLTRWFDEEWINVCYYPNIVPCGRENSDKGKYPYCRPLNRVNPKSPKSVKELSPKERTKLCKEKRKSPEKRVFVKSTKKSPKKSPKSPKSPKSKKSKNSQKKCLKVKKA
jgi:hypothetical protein